MGLVVLGEVWRPRQIGSRGDGGILYGVEFSMHPRFNRTKKL